MWVGRVDEDVVWPKSEPFKPRAYYDSRMDILRITTRDVTTVSCPANDPDSYFDLLYGVKEDGTWDQVVGVQIWGFSGLFRAQSPWELYELLKKARKERANEQSKSSGD
jgi:hypothetical protein